MVYHTSCRCYEVPGIDTNNVISLMDGNKLNDFIKLSYLSLKPGGVLYLGFENPIQEQQLVMRAAINDMVLNNIGLDIAVMKSYQKYEFGTKKAKCSAEEYFKTSYAFSRNKQTY